MEPQKTISIIFGDHDDVRGDGDGFSLEELQMIEQHFVDLGTKTELIMLNKEHQPEAALLVLRNGLKTLSENEIAMNELFEEMKGVDWDKKGKLRGRVVNKVSRFNISFGHHPRQPNYEEGICRVIPYDEVPRVKELKRLLEQHLGEKFVELEAEGNYYHDIAKCKLGYHGDTERRVVVGVRLGASFPLHFRWYKDRVRSGERITVDLDGGDLFLMSDKAVGYDWKRRRVEYTWTLRHAAGPIDLVEKDFDD